MSILGTRVLRTEDPRLLTGKSRFLADLDDERLAGAVHAYFVRSTVPHGRITAIATTAAEAMPGVVAVYTAVDLPMLPIPPRMRPMERKWNRQPMATDTVRYVGEPVAIVLAETERQAVDAAERVEVDIEWLDAVIDPVLAARDETLLFPDDGTNINAHQGPDTLDPQLFDGCEIVVEQHVINQRLAPASMEGRAGAAVWDLDGRLTMWTSNQGAQGAKEEITTMLGLPPEQVRVITPDVGGGFGAKARADAEHGVIAAAARRAGRAVIWVENRSENLIGMVHGRAQVQDAAIGGTSDGRITAYRLDILQDSGAYPAIGAILPTMTRLMAPGVYDIARMEARSRSVLTNTTPVGAYRGAGRPEAAAVLERMIDAFAQRIGMDPVEVRRRNFIDPAKFPFKTLGKATYDSGNYAGALDKVVELADYDNLRAEQRARRESGGPVQLGIGLSTYVEITMGGDQENATVELHEDGTVTVLTGTSPHGQGHATAWAMIVSDQLGVPVEKITVIHGDTDLIPQGGGTGGSRSLQLGGTAVHAATGDLVEEAKKRAAQRLEADVADLQLDARRQAIVVKGSPSVSVPLTDLAKDDPLSAHRVWNGVGPTFPFGAQIAVVEVDTETGNARLRDLFSCDDAGRILNPMLFDGQRQGGIAQGAAQALYEEFVYDEDGNPLTATFMDYNLPTAADLPDFTLAYQETETPYNPLGAKGIGEAGTIGATPAVQNAVVDALAHLGVTHIDMPTTPERVWRAIAGAPGVAVSGGDTAVPRSSDYEVD